VVAPGVEDGDRIEEPDGDSEVAGLGSRSSTITPAGIRAQRGSAAGSSSASGCCWRSRSRDDATEKCGSALGHAASSSLRSSAAPSTIPPLVSVWFPSSSARPGALTRIDHVIG
jgi:hypothetical protein